MPRAYTLRRRAEQVHETRRRITEAAVELHGTVGPAHTTVSAIAERAGVQRLTVYRHFPDEDALFAACSTHWLAENPPPDPAAWAVEHDAGTRAGFALDELYAYYEHTAPMWERVLRDAPSVPALREPMAAWLAHLERARDVLAEPWRVRGARRVRVHLAIGHALDFTTWTSLTRQGARRSEAVSLMVEMIRAARKAALR